MNRSSVARQNVHFQQITRDYEEIRKLISLLPADKFRFTFFQEQNVAPYKYLLDAKIRSVSGISSYGSPMVRDGLTIEIFLPFNYPEKELPRLRIEPPLFHPHVRLPLPILGDRMGTWVDPREQRGGLGSLLLWVLHSLVYQPSYIIPSAADIANREALAWFHYWNMVFQNSQVSGLFPTDPIQLPEASTFIPKTFEVEAVKGINNRKFKVDAGHPNEQVIVSSGKSFEILETKPAYQPETGRTPSFKTSMGSNFRGASRDQKLYLKPKAVEQIFEHIGWGKRTAENRVEQGGILVGNVIQDENQVLFGVVEEAIPGRFAKGNSAYLEMDHETWKGMFDEVDQILDANPDDRMQIIGWYHTHPNMLDVFMSSTNSDTQQHTFPNDWQFAIVFNPQREIWRVFHGRDVDECQGYFIANES